MTAPRKSDGAVHVNTKLDLAEVEVWVAESPSALHWVVFESPAGKVVHVPSILLLS